MDFSGPLIDRYHRGLAQHNPPAAHVNQRIGGAQVDRYVAAAKPGKITQKTYECLLSNETAVFATVLMVAKRGVKDLAPP